MMLRRQTISSNPWLRLSDVDGLAGIFASKVMPEALRNRVAADVAAISREPEVRRELEAGGHTVLNGTTEELKAGIARQRAWLAEVTKLINIRNAQ